MTLPAISKRRQKPLAVRRRIRNRRILFLSCILASAACNQYFGANFNKIPQHTSQLTGETWVQELLQGHSARIRNNLGVSQRGFIYILEILESKGGLAQTRHMSTEEQLAIFLYAVTTDLSIRKLAERFQRSTETIDRVYHKVMDCFLSKTVYQLYVHPATELSVRVATNPKFMPFFKDCIGAIDGTHIAVCPPATERAAFRDRNGKITQNVLAAVDFDMRFTDIMAGWEGSTADSTLWKQAMRQGALQIPESKYMLGDAGFPNCDKCLTPYRKVRYHLQEWAKGSRKPQSKEELFNLRHSQFRNVVERVFGVNKSRFKILTNARSFSMKAQIKIVAALSCLHNILVEIGEGAAGSENLQAEEYPVDEDDPDIEDCNTVLNGEGYKITKRETTRANQRRDDIATAMWEQYQGEIDRNNARRRVHMD